MVLLLLGVGLWASWPRPLGLLIDIAGVSGPPVDPPLPDKPSIAVLPFSNMSDDPEQEYFSDGITEDLTTELARYPNLFVISRNSAFTYKGKHAKVEDVGRELGVRYVLEGSVRKAGDRVRITAQLIDATTGGHLWSERYDRDLSDIFAVQSEIAEEILGAVDVEIGAAEAQRLARKPSESLTAVEAAWKGIYHLNRVTRDDNEKARRLFAHAVELDPAFADAHAFLGITYVTEFAAGWSSNAKLLDRAEELGHRAIALDESLPSGHQAVAWVHLNRGNSAEAIAAAERVIELAPSDEFGLSTRGLALAQEGRFLEATGAVRQALRLNPRAPTALLANVAAVNFAVGRREEAVKQLERVRTANPDHIISRVILVAYYEREGRRDQASTAVAEILRVTPEFSVERARELMAPYENALGSAEFEEYMAALRAAGLPE
jgi:adenylate cyclase